MQHIDLVVTYNFEQVSVFFTFIVTRFMNPLTSFTEYFEVPDEKENMKRCKRNKTLCAIWYNLHNSKNVKNTHG